ncbi:proline-rich protein 15 [Dromaius novaehollandiae]|uniref:proline-rich protein 15 n=1 Tax=Dromaius novaehollandiae TaxID=8790 RepID=UPI00311EAE48
MADSAAAVKGGSAAPWWKALTGKKKPQEAAPPPAEPPAPPSPGAREGQTPPAAEPKGSGRRGLRVSHSGRFKERRKVRASLLADGPEVFDGSGPGPAGRE